MEVKKSPKADLEKKRFLFFEIGLVVALLLTLLAFEWRSKPAEMMGYFGLPGENIDEEQVPITRQQKQEPPPPPPPIDPFELNIVEDETLLEIQPEFEDVETDISDEIDFSDLSMLQEEEATEEAFFMVEDMPLFMGRDANTFSTWIQRTMVYPPSAVQNRVSGRMIVYFEISFTGEVTHVRILQGLSPELDNEVIRVIESSNGLWTPGKQRGRPVRVQFNFPIAFVL